MGSRRRHCYEAAIPAVRRTHASNEVTDFLQNSGRGIDEIPIGLEQLVAARHVSLRLLHRRHVDRQQRLPQVLICAERAQ